MQGRTNYLLLPPLQYHERNQPRVRHRTPSRSCFVTNWSGVGCCSKRGGGQSVADLLLRGNHHRTTRAPGQVCLPHEQRLQKRLYEVRGKKRIGVNRRRASAQRIAYKVVEKTPRRKGFRDILLRRHGKRKGRRKERIRPITGRSANRYKQMPFAEPAPSLHCDQPKLNPLEVRRTMSRGGGLNPRANHDTGTKPGGREEGGAECRSRASSGVEKLRVSGDPRISCRNAHRSQVDAGVGDCHEMV